jgi:hypothetical protein
MSYLEFLMQYSDIKDPLCHARQIEYSFLRKFIERKLWAFRATTIFRTHCSRIVTMRPLHSFFHPLLLNPGTVRRFRLERCL